MINEKIKSTYDSVKYQSHAFANSSINKLCATARVYGLKAPCPDSARVLEIGCGCGANIISQAINYPNADFLGIDLSGEQIKIGQNAIEKSGLKNIKLLQMDAAKACEEFAGREFDYIICHGVFSWVPDFVKSAILEIGAKLLSAKGVMMISFNAYPGWKYKEPTRDFMRFTSREIDGEKDPDIKLDLALAALNYQSAVYNTVPLNEKLVALQMIRNYNNIMAAEIDAKKANRSYLAHEYLEIFNSPSYLVDFAADASDLGLAYVEDVCMHFDHSELANPTVREFATTYFKDRIAKDQMFDFIYATQFRHALLTKKQNENELVFDYKQIDKNLDELYIRLNAKYEDLKERTKGLAMEDLAVALVDAYPGFISGKEAKKLIKSGTLAEHIFDINSALNNEVSFSCKSFDLVPYSQGKTRLNQSYKTYINYLKNDANKMLSMADPLNSTLVLGEYDFGALALLDGKKTKVQIAKELLDMLYKDSKIANKQKEQDLKKVLAQIEKLISDLELHFMLEEI